MLSALTNPASMLAANQYARVTSALNKNLERLATGKRVNRAADDPAGSVSISQLRSDRMSVKTKMDQLEFKASYLGARDGAKSVVSDLLTELNGYVVTAANTAAMSPDEREALQVEVNGVLDAIDHLALTSRFNNQQLLDGQQAANLGVWNVTTVNDKGESVTTRYSLASLRSGGSLNLTDGDLSRAQELLKSLSSSYNAERAQIGAEIKGVDSELRVLEAEYINLSDAQSKIEDTDYASEVSAMVRNQVLQQAAAFAMRMAQEHGSKRVLSLLKN